LNIKKKITHFTLNYPFGARRSDSDLFKFL